MHLFTIEMQPSLCRHCAKYHTNRQQQEQEQQHQQQTQQSKYQESDKNRECLDSLHSERFQWLTLAMARKKSSKFRESGRIQIKCNESTIKNTMKPPNDLVFHTTDQHLQHSNNISIMNLQSTQNSESIRNDISNALQLVNTNQINGLNSVDDYKDEISTDSVNDAFDDHKPLRQSINMTSIHTDTQRSSSSMSTTQQQHQPQSNQCDCSNGDQHSTLTSTSHHASGQLYSKFSVNMHMETHPTGFNVKRNGANDDSESKRRINIKNGIDSDDSSRRSVRTVSANYMKNNQAKKYAHVNHRWPYAISSTLNYSHVLLICIAFMFCGIRSTFVLADDTPANQKGLALAERNGSKYKLCSCVYFNIECSMHSVYANYSNSFILHNKTSYES